jgi:hypothetical protein
MFRLLFLLSRGAEQHLWHPFQRRLRYSPHAHRLARHAHKLARLVVLVLSFDISELLLKGRDSIAKPLMQ